MAIEIPIPPPGSIPDSYYPMLYPGWKAEAFQCPHGGFWMRAFHARTGTWEYKGAGGYQKAAEALHDQIRDSGLIC